MESPNNASCCAPICTERTDVSVVVIVDAIRSPWLPVQADGDHQLSAQQRHRLFAPVARRLLERNHIDPYEVDGLALSGPFDSIADGQVMGVFPAWWRKYGTGQRALHYCAESLSSDPDQLLMVGVVDAGRPQNRPVRSVPQTFPEAALQAFAQRSHRRAADAHQYGDFDSEIAAPTMDTEHNVIPARDDVPASPARPRAAPGLDDPTGAIPTAGAAAALLCTEDFAFDSGLKPRARILASVAHRAADLADWAPTIEHVTNAALDRSGIALSALDHVEVEECDSAFPLAWNATFNVPDDILNPRGGSLALGEAGRASGMRLLVTMINSLEATGGRHGLQLIQDRDGTGYAQVIQIIRKPG